MVLADDRESTLAVSPCESGAQQQKIPLTKGSEAESSSSTLFDSDVSAGSSDSDAETPKRPSSQDAALEDMVHREKCASVEKKKKTVAQRLGIVLLRCLHSSLWVCFHVSTTIIMTMHSFLALFISGKPADPVLERPRRRITPEILEDTPDPAQAVRDLLPAPPLFPEVPAEGITISFGPCANLMIYLGGVCSCLQRCPNWKEVSPRIRFYGCSCGAIMAAMMAADVDMLGQIPAMCSWTARFKKRLWGLVGAYSASIAPIIRELFADPERFELAKSRLTVGATLLSPAPEHAIIGDFDTPEELTSCVLGSCYIPVAFEEPQWSTRHGLLLDGGICGFQVNGDVVISPYQDILPEVGPEEPYPRSLVFFAPHRSDAASLFEDGYNDCMAWLQTGGKMERRIKRAETFAHVSGYGPLLNETKRFIREAVCGRPKAM